MEEIAMQADNFWAGIAGAGLVTMILSATKYIVETKFPKKNKNLIAVGAGFVAIAIAAVMVFVY